MSIYTIADPLGKAHGSTGVKVAAGIAHVGENIDLTVPEFNALNGSFDLRAGVVAVTPTTPYKRFDSSVARANRTLN